MKQALDQLLLRYVHGDLGVVSRLRVRLELLTSRKARKRVHEFVIASESFAAALSPIGGAAFHAARAVRQLRLAIIDGIVAAAILGGIAGGVAWSAKHWPGASCEPTPQMGTHPVSTHAVSFGQSDPCKSSPPVPNSM
jgi:anti-sigma factor RsiW